MIYFGEGATLDLDNAEHTIDDFMRGILGISFNRWGGSLSSDGEQFIQTISDIKDVDFMWSIIYNGIAIGFRWTLAEWLGQWRVFQSPCIYPIDKIY